MIPDVNLVRSFYLYCIFISYVCLTLLRCGLAVHVAVPEVHFVPEFISVPDVLIVGPSMEWDGRPPCEVWPAHLFSRVTVHHDAATATATTVNRNDTFLPVDLKNHTVVHKLSFQKLYCLATTDVGSIRSRSFHIISSGNNSLSSSDEPILEIRRFFEGDTAVIRCQPPQSVQSEASVRFSVNGSVIEHDNNKYRVIRILDQPATAFHMLIHRFSHSDQAIYRCIVKPSEMPVGKQWLDSRSYHALIDENHKLSIQPTRIVEDVGVQITLNCTGYHTVPVVWYFNGHRISTHQPNFVLGAGATLTIRALRLMDTGVFQCSSDAFNGHERVSEPAVVVTSSMHKHQSMFLKKDFRPLAFNDRSMERLGRTRRLVRLGETIVLSCLPDAPGTSLTSLAQLLLGDPDAPLHRVSDALAAIILLKTPPILVRWLKDGTSLPLPVDSWEGAFKLTVTRLSDYGLYECLVDVNGTVGHLRPLFSRQICLSRPTGKQFCSPASLSPTEIDHIHSGFGNREKRNIAIGLKEADRMQPSNYSNPPGRTGSNLNEPHLIPHAVYTQADNIDSWSNDPNNAGPVLPRHNQYSLSAPLAFVVGDNLAAAITWTCVQADSYRLILKKKSPVSDRWVGRSALDLHPAHGSCHIYLTGQQQQRADGLEPGFLYKFRIHSLRRGVVTGTSPWSKTISFEHISHVAPVIKITRRVSEKAVLIQWSLATEVVGFPIDHFMVLHRPEIRYGEGNITYGPFDHAIVPGGETRHYTLENLDPDTGYQVVVYGVHIPPDMDPNGVLFMGGIDGRRVTRLSHEVYVKLKNSTADVASINPSRLPPSSTNNVDYNTSADSNRLMFLILGVLAGLLLIVILSLVLLCVCRQQRDRKRMKLYCHPFSSSSSSSSNSRSSRVRRSKSASSTLHNDSSKAFVLEHLNSQSLSVNQPDHYQHPRRSNHLQQRYSNRSSLLYPQPPPPPPPPPMSPAPLPPGRNLTQSIAYPQDYPSCDLSYPAPSSLCMPPECLENGVAPMLTQPCVVYPNPMDHSWITTGSYCPQAQQNHQMIPSNYSNTQLIMPQGYPVYSTMPATFMPHQQANFHSEVSQQQIQPPLGLKREPPSGGSVHDGTDDNDSDPNRYKHVSNHATLPQYDHRMTNSCTAEILHHHHQQQQQYPTCLLDPRSNRPCMLPLGSSPTIKGMCGTDGGCYPQHPQPLMVPPTAYGLPAGDFIWSPSAAHINVGFATPPPVLSFPVHQSVQPTPTDPNLHNRPNRRVTTQLEHLSNTDTPANRDVGFNARFQRRFPGDNRPGQIMTEQLHHQAYEQPDQEGTNGGHCSNPPPDTSSLQLSTMGDATVEEKVGAFLMHSHLHMAPGSAPVNIVPVAENFDCSLEMHAAVGRRHQRRRRRRSPTETAPFSAANGIISSPTDEIVSVAPADSTAEPEVPSPKAMIFQPQHDPSVVFSGADFSLLNGGNSTQQSLNSSSANAHYKNRQQQHSMQINGNNTPLVSDQVNVIHDPAGHQFSSTRFVTDSYHPSKAARSRQPSYDLPPDSWINQSVRNTGSLIHGNHNLAATMRSVVEDDKFATSLSPTFPRDIPDETGNKSYSVNVDFEGAEQQFLPPAAQSLFVNQSIQ